MRYLLLLLLAVVPAFCQQHPLAARTLVVFASNNSTSRNLAKEYQSARGIPAANLCAIKPPDNESESIAQDAYLSAFRKPIRACLDKVGSKEILYIVMVWISQLGFKHPSNNMDYSIDSYLMDPYDEITTTDATYSNGANFPPVTHGYYANVASNVPTFIPMQTLAEWRAANPSKHMYSVWRIDGDTPQLARRLINQALAAEAAGGPDGKACFDNRIDPRPSYTYSGTGIVEWDIYRAGWLFESVHWSGGVVQDFKEPEFGQAGTTPCLGAAFYAGWYGGAGSFNGTYSWVAGAVGIHIDSASIRSLRSAFKPGGQPDGTWGYQSLKRGLAVTSGALSEPYTVGLPRPAGVFHDLLAGSNVGDAFVRNTQWAVKWMLINVGDPLYTPFGGRRKPPLAGR